MTNKRSTSQQIKLGCHIHNYTEYNEEWNVFSAFNPSKCTHLEQWAADCAAPGEQSWTSCRSRDSNPQPWVTSGFKSNALSIRPTTAQFLPNIIWLFPLFCSDLKLCKLHLYCYVTVSIPTLLSWSKVTRMAKVWLFSQSFVGLNSIWIWLLEMATSCGLVSVFSVLLLVYTAGRSPSDHVECLTILHLEFHLSHVFVCWFACYQIWSDLERLTF